MATSKVTDLTELTSVADDDLIMVVDVSDTTDSDDGTSKKISKSNLVAGLGGGATKTMVNGSFFDNTIRDVYLPVGNTETEYTTLQRSNKLPMPYAGQLLRVSFRSEFSAPSSGTLTLTLREVSLTNSVTDKESITLTPTYGARMEYTFEFTSAAVMTEGKTYAFRLDNDLNVALGNVSFTIVIEQ